MTKLVRLGISVATSGMFSALVLLSGILADTQSAALTSILFALLLAGAIYWATGEIREDMIVFAMVTLLLVFGMAFRMLSLDKVTSDYYAFLQNWVQIFRQSGVGAFQETFSDYNMPYLYFLWGISKVPVSDLYLLKFVSVIGDLFVVFLGVRLVKHFHVSCNTEIGVLALLWLAPTMWLNSAFWGQCDSIYAAFVLGALLAVLKRKPVLSVALVAVAFSFKLQTVFFLPIYLILIMIRRVKWRHLPVFPVVYFITVLPAWLLGKPMGDILGVYTNQMGLYSARLNLNSPSAYALLPEAADGLHAVFFPLGILAAVVFLALVYFYVWRGRAAMNDKLLVFCAFVLCAGIPWFLPSMHDRYFYLADVLSVVFMALCWRRWVVPLLTIFASYGGYHAYLFLRYLPFGLETSAIAMFMAIALVSKELFTALLAGGRPAVPEPLPELQQNE